VEMKEAIVPGMAGPGPGTKHRAIRERCQEGQLVLLSPAGLRHSTEKWEHIS
jgi:hypothetical protein